MNRLRLYDLRMSRLPAAVGLCQGDTAAVAALANAAQRRLLYAREAGDEGWWGTWAEIAFEVDPASPYIALPRGVARLQNITVNDDPVPIRNQWFEFVQFGTGRMAACCTKHQIQVLSMNNAVTRVEMTSAPQILRFYPQSGNDETRRIFVQGNNASGEVIRSEDNGGIVEGIFLSLSQPYTETPFGINSLDGIQKDVTAGEVRIAQVDPITGDEVTLHTMEPSETTAWYRRYKLASWPCTGDAVQCSAIAKLELIECKMDTDYLLIQELEALIEECMAVHYSGTDTSGGKQFAMVHHRNATNYLNGQLRHYVGTKEPTMIFQPIPSFANQRIGSLI